MANADFTRLSFVKESSFATAVATPTMLEANITACDFRMQVGKAQSRLIRSDAQAIRGTKTSESAVGQWSGELQYDITGAFFEVLKASMRSDAEEPATTTVSPVSYATSQLSGTGVGTDVEVGDILRVRDTNDALVGYFAVTVRDSANLVTIDGVPGTTSNLKVTRGTRIKNDTVFTSFNAEEAHEDLTTPTYELFLGMVPGRFQTQTQIDQPTTFVFDFVGSHSDGGGTTPISGATFTPGPTTGVVKTTLPKIYIDGETFCATSISCGWTINAAARRCIDQQRARGIRTGKFQASGSATIYFEDLALYQASIADTESRMYYVLEDSASNAIVYAFPNVQWGEASHPVTGENSDVFLTLPWTAAVDSAENIVARVLFFPAANP